MQARCLAQGQEGTVEGRELSGYNPYHSQFCRGKLLTKLLSDLLLQLKLAFLKR